MSDESSEKPLFAGLNDAEIENVERLKVIESKYRFIFTGSEMSTEVLADILITFCHFGELLSTSQGMEHYNVGVAILKRMGIIVEGNEINFIRALLNTLPKKEV